MNRLVSFNFDFGRSGCLTGMSVMSLDEWTAVHAAIGSHIYFGEVLGKHSEVQGTLDSSDVKVMSDDQELCGKLLEVFPNGHMSGVDLIDYVRMIDE